MRILIKLRNLDKVDYEGIILVLYLFILSLNSLSKYFCINLLRMSSQDRFRKNQSMNSTHHMSCNHSNTTNFYIGNKPKTATVVNYSRIPIPKECPRWTQSASTWRHTSHKYGFSKDSRFKDNSSYCSDIIEPHLPSSINSNKSCTFGKGNKRPISVVVLRNAK